MSDQQQPTSDQNTPQPVNSAAPAQQAASQTFDWSKLGVAGLSAVAGIVATPAGPWIALGVFVIALVGFFFLRSWWKNTQFQNNKAQAGSKAGQDASDGQKKDNDNRDQVDVFLGRDSRS